MGGRLNGENFFFMFGEARKYFFETKLLWPKTPPLESVLRGLVLY